MWVITCDSTLTEVKCDDDAPVVCALVRFSMQQHSLVSKFPEGTASSSRPTSTQYNMPRHVSRFASALPLLPLPLLLQGTSHGLGAPSFAPAASSTTVSTRACLLQPSEHHSSQSMRLPLQWRPLTYTVYQRPSHALHQAMQLCRCVNGEHTACLLQQQAWCMRHAVL